MFFTFVLRLCKDSAYKNPRRRGKKMKGRGRDRGSSYWFMQKSNVTVMRLFQLKIRPKLSLLNHKKHDTKNYSFLKSNFKQVYRVE
jgi:hypothetical protein